jgi:hypothetical protein
LQNDGGFVSHTQILLTTNKSKISRSFIIAVVTPAISPALSNLAPSAHVAQEQALMASACQTLQTLLPATLKWTPLTAVFPTLLTAAFPMI